jgi:hypothetical protein
MGLRLARGLAGMLRAGLSFDEAARRVRHRIATRAASFLELVRCSVYERLESPYRPLLKAAGIELCDLVRLVESEGVESSLERLFDAGVRISLEQFKGRRPLKASGVERPLDPADFDNHRLERHFDAWTGGTRGSRRRVAYDLDQIALENASEMHLLRHLGVLGRPAAMWRPVPPGAAGLRIAIRGAQRGSSFEKWFSQERVRFAGSDRRHGAVLTLARGLSVLYRRRIPWPEHVPIDEAWRVAEWIAGHRRAGRECFVDTNPASAVRICQAARSRNLDASGTIFRLGGEPYTPGKRRAIEEAGCRGYTYYSMTEAGIMGMACGSPDQTDEMHLLTDKIAVIERPTSVEGLGAQVNALYVTSLLPSSQKILLNVETGDYGTMFERRCACPLETLGLHRHLSGVLSYEKLVSEGMLFIGDVLVRIVDEILPARFGGNGTDYQFVEREENGLPRVDLRVNPRLGAIDEAAVLESVFDALSGADSARAMAARRWKDGKTLRVRRDPALGTSAAKILPLHFDGGPRA